MATLVPEMPANEPGGFLSDLAGMGDFFISPSSAAKYVFRKWFWVGPLALFSIVSFIAAMIMAGHERGLGYRGQVPGSIQRCGGL